LGTLNVFVPSFSSFLLGCRLRSDLEKQQFEELVLVHLDFLMGVAVNLTRDRDRAEDLVQDAVLKAFRFFDGFRPGSNFRAWVARIMTNTYFTQQQRAKRVEYGIDPVDVPDLYARENPAGEPDRSVRTLDDIPSGEFSDEVVNALHELPGEMALAVYLADVEQIPYAEIGEILDAPVGTVRSRIARGRRHLQKRLVDFAREYRITGS
jgi:RNA polymerase sigma-70 factor (ECF subfamily)